MDNKVVTEYYSVVIHRVDSIGLLDILNRTTANEIIILFVAIFLRFHTKFSWKKNEQKSLLFINDNQSNNNFKLKPSQIININCDVSIQLFIS